MSAGKTVAGWWQRYAAGRLRTPQAIVAASRAEMRDAAVSSDRFFGLPVDSPHWDAPERLKAPSFFLSNAFLLQQDRADWQNADPRLMHWAALYVELARRRSIPLYVHTCYRGQREQDELRKAGRSRTAYPSSAHNIGEAVDVVHGVFHWDMTRAEWSLLHVLGCLALDRVNSDLQKDRKLSLTWGGSWRSLWDPAHWEISDYRLRSRRLPPGPPVRYTPRHVLAMR